MPDTSFIEIAALPADQAGMYPGTVIVGLSSAQRGASRWRDVADDLDEQLQYR
ncbi:hypothetical protein [Microbacterium sp. P04]|uniref:hypothetical protein n=1 Tax=Microbacterium sp. P04 TaxID=3366947 RepID=UPI00374641BF